MANVTVVKGDVKVIKIESGGQLSIKLNHDGPSPKSGFFRVAQTDPRFDSVYSLALAAYINEYRVRIRTQKPIKKSQYAEIMEFSVGQ